MFTKKTLLTSVFVSTIALSATFSGAVSASTNESPVSAIVANMMQNVITQAGNEIDVQLQKSIIQLGHAVDITGEQDSLPPTKVTITDLAAIDFNDALNQSEQSND